MIIQLPYEDGSYNKKAVITDYEKGKEAARTVYKDRLGYHPRFINYNELSESNQALWDKFIRMLVENSKEPINPDYYIHRKTQ